jgi:hypothetical protein
MSSLEDSKADAKEKLRWYAMRWKIETFHKILKSGCKAEDSRLRSAERLANLFAIFCILGWRIFWITMLRREIPDAEPSVAFTSSETAILARLTHATQPMTLHDCILQVAKLGGYLARAKDPPPGNLVIWRGLSRLSDLVLGASLQVESCG